MTSNNAPVLGIIFRLWTLVHFLGDPACSFSLFAHIDSKCELLPRVSRQEVMKSKSSLQSPDTSNREVRNHALSSSSCNTNEMEEEDIIAGLILANFNPKQNNNNPAVVTITNNDNIDAATRMTKPSNSNSYYIERVNSKKRALDVKVFRQFSISAAEYIISQQQSGTANLIMTEQEAINQLMPGYDDFGNYIRPLSFAPPGGWKNSDEREVYFVAVHNGKGCFNIDNIGANVNVERIANIDEWKKIFTNQNGVIGVVSAKLRYSPPSSTLASSSSAISSPHIYLANMRVHPLMQRRGIGSALLSAVCDYAKSLIVNRDVMNVEGHINTNNEFLSCKSVVLSVDNDNLNAIQMYEKFGFRYLERYEEFGVMGVDLR